MITAFRLLCECCGLSAREAADYLSVSLNSVQSWSVGRRETPDGAIGELRNLYAAIELAATEDLAVISAAGPGGVVELGLAPDDAEARSLGWPCVGAHGAVLGIVAARARVPVAVIPRGSTPATAAAADRHDRALSAQPRS